jgi:hypothetical protein
MSLNGVNPESGTASSWSQRCPSRRTGPRALQTSNSASQPGVEEIAAECGSAAHRIDRGATTLAVKEGVKPFDGWLTSCSMPRPTPVGRGHSQAYPLWSHPFGRWTMSAVHVFRLPITDDW